MGLEQAVLEKLRTLPIVQQQMVLDFVEFLQAKFFLTNSHSQRSDPGSSSALEAAGDLVGCVQGSPFDLSTNKSYIEGFGEE